MDRPLFLMTEPGNYGVVYSINPWMRPQAWGADPVAGLSRAAAASEALRAALETAGARVEMIEGAAGLPDMVFPANAAVVLDRRALLARFRFPERQGEEARFSAAFEGLRDRGVIDEVLDLPAGLFQEGAGDACWDAARGLFWTGWGPRSDQAAAGVIARTFGREAVNLGLATDRFYHLDTCFCPLSGGEVLYYPPAFTPKGLADIHARVPADLRIEATGEDAEAFCVNAVNFGRDLVTARAPRALRRRLEARGYRMTEVDLSPFLLSGGGAYCMTLRLDRRATPALQPLSPRP